MYLELLWSCEGFGGLIGKGKHEKDTLCHGIPQSFSICERVIKWLPRAHVMIGNSRFSLRLRDRSLDSLDFQCTKASGCSLQLRSRCNRSLKVKQGGTSRRPALSCGDRGSALSGRRSFVWCSHLVCWREGGNVEECSTRCVQVDTRN